MLRKAVEKRPSNTGEEHSLPLSLLNGKIVWRERVVEIKGVVLASFFFGGGAISFFFNYVHIDLSNCACTGYILSDTCIKNQNARKVKSLASYGSKDSKLIKS